MTHALVLLFALLIGVVAGLRALTAPAVLAWTAMLGWLVLDGTWLEWLGHPETVTVLTIFAVGELVMDQLPGVRSRTASLPFLGRLIAGGFAGAVVGTAWGYPIGGLGAGLIGAVLGTIGGYQVRTRLTTASGGRDWPFAVLEDLVAVAGGVAVAALVAGL